jgi:hypothetical protein
VQGGGDWQVVGALGWSQVLVLVLGRFRVCVMFICKSLYRADMAYGLTAYLMGSG